MPGELATVVAGRVANLFNLHGPNFIVDAACASALAAMDASVEGLLSGSSTRPITGGVDRNMGASTFVKFCAIGALSAHRHAPVRRRRRRLRDGRGRGAVRAQAPRRRRARRRSDLRGRPRHRRRQRRQGQGHHGAQPGRPAARGRARLARTPGCRPPSCTLVEGHGTSTRVGDVVEAQRLSEAFARAQSRRPDRSRSARSSRTSATSRRRPARPGMLKADARAATRRCCPRASTSRGPIRTSTWLSSPLRVNTELREWDVAAASARVARASAHSASAAPTSTSCSRSTSPAA